MSNLTPMSRACVTAPGRINLLGEHVDYNDGIVLPVAIDRVLRLEATLSSNCIVQLTALDLGKSTSFSLENLDQKIDLQGSPLPGWALYPAGVAWALGRAGFKLHGFNGEYSSELPIGAGLSSSAAVEVGFGVMWQFLGGWEMERMELASYCLQAEIEYVGLNCGIMDQFAVANGVEGHALYLDTRSLEWQAVPLPPRTTLVIADPHLLRRLADSEYNKRHAACEAAVSLLKQDLPGIHALRDVTPSQLTQFSHLLPDEIYQRARHVVDECARMEKALQFLKAGDAFGFGRLMIDGHISLRDFYEVSCPELDVLVNTATGLPGCYGARLTGAGFGGCTISLVDSDQADPFVKSLRELYQIQTGKEAEVYICHASRGAWAGAC
jgi:galactokinase